MLCDFHCLKHVKAAPQSFVTLLDLAIYWNKMITCLFVFKMWCVCHCKVTAPLFFSIHSLFFTATQNSVIDREGWWWWWCTAAYCICSCAQNNRSVSMVTTAKRIQREERRGEGDEAWQHLFPHQRAGKCPQSEDQTKTAWRQRWLYRRVGGFYDNHIKIKISINLRNC